MLADLQVHVKRLSQCFNLAAVRFSILPDGNKPETESTRTDDVLNAKSGAVGANLKLARPVKMVDLLSIILELLADPAGVIRCADPILCRINHHAADVARGRFHAEQFTRGHAAVGEVGVRGATERRNPLVENTVQHNVLDLVVAADPRESSVEGRVLSV